MNLAEYLGFYAIAAGCGAIALIGLIGWLECREERGDNW